MVGWFVGGTLGALTAQLFYSPKKRSVPVTIGLTLALGVAVATLRYLLNQYWK
ncbi:MAG: hypothetical protein AAB305_06415 [Candidatus Zixiibacteriota bacterium]